MTSGKTDFQAPPTRFLPMLLAIGPAIVVSGSVIGSGELINVPVQAARFGFVLFYTVSVVTVGGIMTATAGLLLLVLFPNPKYPLHLSDVLSGLKFSLADVDRDQPAGRARYDGKRTVHVSLLDSRERLR